MGLYTFGIIVAMELTENKPGNFIFTADGVISAEDCKQIIEKFEQDQRKHPGQLYGHKVNLDIKRSTDFQIRKEFEDWKDTDALLYKVTHSLMLSLGKHLQAIRECTVSDTGYIIQRTKVGQEFVWHSDVGSKGTCNRMFAVIYYLNDVEEGGTTDFHYQDVSIKPAPGRALVFPANFTHIHRGAMVTKGTKYIVTTFIIYA